MPTFMPSQRVLETLVEVRMKRTPEAETACAVALVSDLLVHSNDARLPASIMADALMAAVEQLTGA